MSDDKTSSAVGGFMAIGVCIGTALGAGLGNIPIGMSIGLAVGSICGFAIDWKRNKHAQDESE